jgi:hypothetical protein
VRVPEEAGDGKAKVKLSFADWKEVKVAPTIVEIPVTNVTPSKTPAPVKE